MVWCYNGSVTILHLYKSYENTLVYLTAFTLSGDHEKIEAIENELLTKCLEW